MFLHRFVGLSEGIITTKADCERMNVSSCQLIWVVLDKGTLTKLLMVAVCL